MLLTDGFLSTLSQWTGASLLGRFLDIMQSGGASMWILFALGLLLWYALAARFALLAGGGKLPARQQSQRTGTLPAGGMLAKAARDAIEAQAYAERAGASTRHRVSAAIQQYRTRLRHYATTIKTIVIIAPLIGLLGTIIGMIETFEALQTLAIFSQGSSIAGGISKALYTTQMGLIVGVPGLLLGRVLDRRQHKLAGELDQLQAMVMTRSFP